MKKTLLVYTAIVAVCFLYTGSAYMSQMYVLANFLDDVTVDWITSGIYYILQGIGMGTFLICIKKNCALFGKKNFFIGSLIVGVIPMIGMLIGTNLGLVLTCACIFNFLCGVYFGYYLTMLSKNIPSDRIGLSYGTAYAIASIGTYFFSLIKDGEFLTSKEIIAVYVILSAFTIALVCFSSDLTFEKQISAPKLELNYLIPIIVLMTIISTLGSSLFFSIPFAKNVNFTLVRAFYGIGLIAAGYIIDKSRFVGGVFVLASFTYPLIATALLSGGTSGMIGLIISYICIGFFSVFRVTAFSDLGPFFACVGLMISRIIEAIVSIFAILLPMKVHSQLIITALIYLPLIILFMILSTKKYAVEKPALSDEQRFTIFTEKYSLTAREAEVFRGMIAGLTDFEIAANCYISKNTVRFHISNILRKTSTTSRVEAVRLFGKS